MENKFLNSYERNFLVCSDCAYFKSEEVFDYRYPEVVKGRCLKHDKTVDNRWETKCKDNTYFCQCNMCIHFIDNSEYYIEELEDEECNMHYECGVKHISLREEDRVCEFFETASKE